MTNSGGTSGPIALITGITGQDGTYLTRALRSDGMEVHGVIRPSSTATTDDDVILHTADIRDAEALDALVAELQPDELYHLAGQTSVAGSWDDPVGTLDQTGTPIAALLNAITRHSPHTRLVNAASAEIFGNAPAPQDENTPLAPLSPYGAAKALGHMLVASFRQRGIHASSCILYNHESPLRDERFVTGKIAKAVARIDAGLQDTLYLGSLDVERDWGWAPDYVDAMQRAIRFDKPDDYVIGTGTSHTIQDFVSAAFSAVGIENWDRYVSTDPALVRPADPATQRANSDKARTALGWTTTKAFPDIVTAMVQHQVNELGAELRG